MATAAVLPRNPFDTTTGDTNKALGAIAKVAPNLGAQPAIAASTAKAQPLAEAAQAQAARIAVDPKTQTVAGQLKSIISEGSPLLDQAQTRAAQSANRRGLLNSSMAVTAGESALYDAAMPIAQADAGVYGSAATNNAQFAQQAGLQNAQAKQQNSQFNSSAVGANNQFNAQQTQAAGTRTAELGLTRQQANADNQMKLMLQQMDATTRRDLVNIEANYKSTMQASQSASDLYKHVLTTIGNITADPKMNAGSKNRAIELQKSLLANGMNLIGAMNDIGVGGLLNFGSERDSGVPTDIVLDEKGKTGRANDPLPRRDGTDFG